MFNIYERCFLIGLRSHQFALKSDCRDRYVSCFDLSFNIASRLFPPCVVVRYFPLLRESKIMDKKNKMQVRRNNSLRQPQ